MTPLLSTIQRLYIGDGVFVGGSYVERTGRNVYRIRRDGELVGASVGGRNTHARTAAYLVVQALGYVVEVPCSRCGYNERMAGSSWCAACNRAQARAWNETHIRKRDRERAS